MAKRGKFHSSNPSLTFVEIDGERLYLDGLPVEYDAAPRDDGWLSVNFPSVSVYDYPVKASEILEESE